MGRLRSASTGGIIFDGPSEARPDEIKPKAKKEKEDKDLVLIRCAGVESRYYRFSPCGAEGGPPYFHLLS